MLSLIYEERDPSTTLAWVLLLVLFPGVGVMLYVVFGRNWRLIARTDRQRIEALRARRARCSHRSTRAIRAGAAELSCRETPRSSAGSSPRSARRTAPSRSPASTSRSSRAAPRSSSGCFGDIEAATDHVHLEYFIWEQDALTDAILRPARREGPPGRRGARALRLGRVRSRTASASSGGCERPAPASQADATEVDQAQLPEPPQDRGHRRASRLHRRHEHGPGVHRRQAALTSRGATRTSGSAARSSPTCSGCSRALAAHHAGERLLGAVLPRPRR